MTDPIGKSYLADVRHRLHRLKDVADRAIEQVDDEAFFAAIDEQANSIALIVKHVAGNQRSRWREFLSSDGEKPDRHRDTEFEQTEEDTRSALMARWESGWSELFAAIGPLAPLDLARTVHIRQREHLVIEAINRQLSHYAYHVGQIVLLAKHFTGQDWQWQSIPPGKSEQFNAEMRRTANR